jgi:predicted nucleic acid-binding protein
VTRGSAVVDASALVRGVVAGSDDASEWISALEAGHHRGLGPDLVWAEVASALTNAVRARIMTAEQGRESLRLLLRVPLETRPLAPLADAAFAVSLERGLSAYDAFYVALAEAAEAPLVTADRRLAAATGRSVLVGR